MAANPSDAVGRSPRETVEAFFDGQARNDVEAVVALFSKDATWVIPGDPELVPWVGTRNRDGIGDYMVKQTENAEPTSFELQKMLVDGPDVVVLGRFGFRFPSGGSLDDPFAAHLTVHDGLITSFIIHEDSLNLAREYTRTAVVNP